MRRVTAVLRKHSTEDGLVTIFDHVPLGKQYDVDLDTITTLEMRNIVARKDHKKEVIYMCDDPGRFIPTELIFIPGHTS